MDRRVVQALQLLQEARRLDLLAAGVDHRDRLARQAASGVAPAVAAFLPTRGKRGGTTTQVRRLGRGQSGCSAVAARLEPGARVRRLPVQQEARRAVGRAMAASKEKEGTASAGHAAKAIRKARPPQAGEAVTGALLPRSEGDKGSLENVQGEGRGSIQGGHKGVFAQQEALTGQDREGWGAPVGVGAQGMVSEASTSGDNSSAGSAGGRELSHILE
ncbi:hypothetical protein NDU88_006325 [Pleurodeles waltl]|uniref:Uncharacterized protein n=1 Tax=Pleurodeles waltl TaxID=8319 RepID=A0AAV7RPS3_PLEWA|nr:hypothetical protein NDU88_006325 [Pleurodeles waltl]